MTNTYTNTIIKATVTILAGESESAIVDCTEFKAGAPGPNGRPMAGGAAALRKIILPTEWTVCDISFMDGNLSDGSDMRPVRYTDGADSAVFTIANSSGSDGGYALYPWVFDSVEYFKIKCSIPQAADRTIKLILASIYQGHA